ncbi:unnamed protein product, partial [Prorocentrum cordatum]
DGPPDARIKRAASEDPRARGGGGFEAAPLLSARLPAAESRRHTRENRSSQQRSSPDPDLPLLDLAPGINGSAVATSGETQGRWRTSRGRWLPRSARGRRYRPRRSRGSSRRGTGARPPGQARLHSGNGG